MKLFIVHDPDCGPHAVFDTYEAAKQLAELRDSFVTLCELN